MVANGDATGWFEQLYREAEDGALVVPWADGEANPFLIEWLDAQEPAATPEPTREAGTAGGSGRSALVVGCGLGYDAEFLAGRGFAVTAFDIAPTAIAAAKRANPGTEVTYLTADLLDLPTAWTGAFDLVVEVYTIQPIFGPSRALALAALHRPVAPGGTLLVIAGATNEQDPERDPGLMPWPLTRRELEQAGGPLRVHRIEQYFDHEDPPKLRWRAEFRRD
jgi:SAM-dependent methyltransferase